VAAKQYVHTCERCGQQAHLERTGRFRDEDYHELLAEYLALEHETRRQIARLEHDLSKARSVAEGWQFLAENWEFILRHVEADERPRQQVESECPF
jgi:hypothetical protein